MDDLISRQAAIDGLDSHYVERINLNDWQAGWNNALEWVQGTYLDELPSAQPEVIRCKDCKFYREYGYINGKPKFLPRCGFIQIYVAKDDFCSRAERKVEHE